MFIIFPKVLFMLALYFDLHNMALTDDPAFVNALLEYFR